MSPTPRDADAPRAVRAAVAALLVLGAAAYTSWALEAVLPTGLSPLRTYVSELAAEDQPYGAFYRAVDFAAGVLVCAGAAVGLVRLRCRTAVPRVRALSALGWAGLVVFGAATAADARLPLSCAPTVDAACLARERAGLVPATHTAHAVSSAVAVTGALVGMVLLTAALRRAGAGGARQRTVLTVLVAVELAATVWTLAAVFAFDAGHGTWGLGIGQRLQVLMIAVWLVCLAWLVLVRRRR
ncbi:DUF998 domain-containing protein [Streptomyces spectabilis]|uniref:CBS domain-containing protein n=1 Tax=Streptomyces spectabilis TaxID=68270 RepID=A0A5P2X548_STRST|nr:DUF998 domain-containing protein [Streptomyces spectabilis]MBB5102983.1 CBS domain-containing protein [Streptomyces spectabilis]MCI3902178.1 DUF998 domain-containing protein [Streptomyces spectabilis]QEV59558.1 DUF998 domain-containing protein [Streptomyces spectabilis]GGV15502.1 hypothetical protein GCM10010245_26820 [Streptomyces spectabilis]